MHTKSHLWKFHLTGSLLTTSRYYRLRAHTYANSKTRLLTVGVGQQLATALGAFMLVPRLAALSLTFRSDPRLPTFVVLFNSY